MICGGGSECVKSWFGVEFEVGVGVNDIVEEGKFGGGLEFIFFMFVSIEEFCVMNNVVDVLVEVDEVVVIEGVLNLFFFGM